MRKFLRFFTRPENSLALGIVVSFIIVAIAAPVLAPPQKKDLNTGFDVVGRITDMVPHPPSKTAPLGTMPGQYNIFPILVWGTRSALYFGLVVTACTSFFGVFVGALSGYFGGAAGRLIMQVTDGFLSVPVIVGIVLFRQLILLTLASTGLNTADSGVSTVEEQPNLFKTILMGVDPVMLALILFSWMPYARIMNAVVVDVRQAGFMDAARALGASHLRIILRHLIPNTISPAIVLAARDIGSVVLLQATFTFIGMGGGSDWGELLVLGRSYIIGPGGNPFRYWWVFIPATLTLVLFGVGWNLLGDGLNDWLNPRKNIQA